MLTVTKLEPQKKDPDRWNVYLNGEFAFGISRVVAPWLKEGSELSQDNISDLQTEDKIDRAYQRALNFLSYRNRSVKEIRQNLQKHKISEDIIESVLERLESRSLIDDQEFAREWIENRSKFRPRGKRALSYELYQKGISPEIIEDLLQEINEEDLAMRLVQKKASTLKIKDKKHFQEKLLGYLSRRGFTYQISIEVINSFWNEINQQS